MFRNMLIGGLMIASTIALMWASGARAEEEELERFAGLVCKTPEGVKAVFAIHGKTLESSVATLVSEIRAVNEKEGTEDCNFRQIMEQDQEVVSNFHWRGQDFDIRRIKVWADCNEGVCIYSKQDDAYIAAENKDAAA
jgi:hypothetical protein